MDAVFQRCIVPSCSATLAVDDTAFICPRCGALLDVAYDWTRLDPPRSLKDFEGKWSKRHDPLCLSGVWRFHELMPFARADAILTIGEGQSLFQRADGIARYANLNPGRLFLQYEGMNPSGSFKDNGMTAAFTHARMVGAKQAACASTGNTSASLALFSAASGFLRAIVFIGSGKIAFGKLAQALDHGALTVQIDGDFDEAMRRVRQVASRLGLYIVNSINPFRLEGQKTIMFRVLEALNWEAPDWIVVPAGNLGNMSAFGKAFGELQDLGLIDRPPRLAAINARGANTFYQLYEKAGLRWHGGRVNGSIVEDHYRGLDTNHVRATTVASAIEINHPVNLPKALRALEICGGAVQEVSDQEILDAKAQVGARGFGCEPASAASVAGVRKMREEGVIGRDERVVCILTGHVLKDSTATVAYHGTDEEAFKEVLSSRGVTQRAYANRPIKVANDLEEIIRAIELSPASD